MSDDLGGKGVLRRRQVKVGYRTPTADGSASRRPAHSGILVTCTAGAERKCVRFGHKPWKADLPPYHQACEGLARADDGGDSVGHTRNAAPIDIFDRIGIQADEPAPSLRLEAAFGPDGAVCVAHTRLPDVLDMPALAWTYPRLAGHLDVDCDDSAGLLFVRSVGR